MRWSASGNVTPRANERESVQGRLLARMVSIAVLAGLIALSVVAAKRPADDQVRAAAPPAGSTYYLSPRGGALGPLYSAMEAMARPSRDALHDFATAF